ncbi:hypothetical protein, partial [uncultured Chryseobacterium sp.]|uniref:hypothetical protein n=1 Tax=uncultured Chryseobacterium sp. TaxID=259322 RepID=UPI0025897329
VYSVDCIADELLFSIAHFLFQSTAKYYELFLTKTPTIFDHITEKQKLPKQALGVLYILRY